MIDKSKINTILLVTLSNIGDAILTLPVLDVLRQEFPQAKLTVMTGSRPSSIFDNEPGIEVIIYNKVATLPEKINLLKQLRDKKFDLVVDLRHTAWGFFILPRYITSPFLRIPSSLVHMKDRHMYRLRPILGKTVSPINKTWPHIIEKDKDYIERILLDNGIRQDDKIVVFSVGARSHIKRWKRYGFISLGNRLIERFNIKLILVGDESDAELCLDIVHKMHKNVLNRCGRTTIKQLAYLIKKASLVITNDSAVLHLSSYLNAPVLAIFGPTDPRKYGPWSKDFSLIRKQIQCSPCQKAQCKFNHECMNLIQTQEVFEAASKFLEQ